MIPFYKERFISSKSQDEIMAIIAQSTLPTNDTSSYGHKAEFRGTVYSNGFQIVRNSMFRNSFAPVAQATIIPCGNKADVNLKIGMWIYVIVFMIIWSCGVLAAVTATIISTLEDGIAATWIAIVVCSIFLLTAFSFINFGFYYPYKKMKARMLELLL